MFWRCSKAQRRWMKKKLIRLGFSMESNYGTNIGPRQIMVYLVRHSICSNYDLWPMSLGTEWIYLAMKCHSRHEFVIVPTSVSRRINQTNTAGTRHTDCSLHISHTSFSLPDFCIYKFSYQQTSHSQVVCHQQVWYPKLGQKISNAEQVWFVDLFLKAKSQMQIFVSDSQKWNPAVRNGSDPTDIVMTLLSKKISRMSALRLHV